jgi:hypothetical protein
MPIRCRRKEMEIVAATGLVGGLGAAAGFGAPASTLRVSAPDRTALERLVHSGTASRGTAPFLVNWY